MTLSQKIFVWIFSGSTSLVQAQFGARVDIVHDLDNVQEMHKADIDQDGSMDLIVQSDSVLGWVRNLGGTFGFAPLDTLFTSLWYLDAFEVADVDLDGDIDVVFVDHNDANIYWLENVAGQLNEQHFIANFPQAIGALLCHDITGDGFPDLLINGEGAVHLSVNLNGTFGSQQSFPTAGGMPSPILLVGDLDLDNDQDILAVNWNAFVEIIYNLDGNGLNWSETQFLMAGFWWYDGPFQLIDVNGDGDLDLLDITTDLKWGENLMLEPGELNPFEVSPIASGFIYDPRGRAGFLGCGTMASVLWTSGANKDTLNWTLFDNSINDFSPPIEMVWDPFISLIRFGDMNGDGQSDLIVAHSDSVISWYANELPENEIATIIELTPFDTLCASGSEYELQHATPSSGDWFGANVVTDIFEPIEDGIYELIYSMQDSVSQCPISASQEMVVIDAPEISLISGDVSNSCGLDPLMFQGSPSSGTWGGIVDPEGIVDRSCEARPSIGPVTYTYDAVNGGCTNIDQYLDLLPCMFADIGPDTVICTGSDTLVVSISHPGSGFASLEGPFDTIVTDQFYATGHFDPSSGTNNYEFIAMVVGPGSCPGFDTMNVTVLDTLSWLTIPDTIVELTQPAFHRTGELPIGGFYVINAMVFDAILPLDFGIGMVAVTYVYEDTITHCQSYTTFQMSIESTTGLAQRPSTLPILRPNPASEYCFINLAEERGTM
ncbi:MAG: VCBS repeat-containing protein, partial [Bacteroidota bacterium]|nr:VCBS repeat-containing protein [Bacteroidota bacterium]